MDLSTMPVEGGFRLRGQQVTRLETFVDAAFAFSLTLLVIFFNDLPDTIAELRGALRRVPTFALCFVLLAAFWAAHNRWSRRFGLEDARSTVLSLAFVLVILVYVYPLRMVTSAGLNLLTGGWVPSEMAGDAAHWLLDVQTGFIVYSIGFGLLAGIVWALNAHALRRGDALGLDARERYDTRTEMGMHRIMALSATLSFLLSLAILAWMSQDDPVRWLVGMPMFVYAGMGAPMTFYGWHRDRCRAAATGRA